MNPLIATLRIDMRVQWRNRLYAVGAALSVLIAAVIGFLAGPDQMPRASASVLLLIGGGSTLLYVGAMIIFEKDEGTLNAITVSPVTPGTYLASKTLTLTLICVLETAIMIVGALAILWFLGPVIWPNPLPLVLATIITGIIYTLVGTILIARFDNIADFFVPMGLIGSMMQMPFFYFIGLTDHPFWLIIPTAAPAMLSLAAWRDLSGWEWLYGLSYSAVAIGGLGFWARAAFVKHVVRREG